MYFSVCVTGSGFMFSKKCFVPCHGNRAGVSKFDLGCFQDVNGPSSAHRAFPELRVELHATLEHARGPKIDQNA